MEIAEALAAGQCKKLRHLDISGQSICWVVCCCLLCTEYRCLLAEWLVAGSLAGRAAMIELAEEVLAGHCKQLRHLDVSGN